MPTTMKLIAKSVLGADTATVSFGSIPGTYTDLLLVGSARTSRASVVDGIYFHLNADANNNMTSRYLQGNGASASSSSTSAAQKLDASALCAGTNATASTFGSFELYLPNYAGSTNKSLSISAVHETNATTAYVTVIAGLWAKTDAVTSIDMTSNNAADFKSGSSFFLFGIAKA